MTDAPRRFTVERTRVENGAIVDAVGWTGRWPFRRRISFHAGINCNSIGVEDSKLVVLQSDRPIAVAQVKPGMLAGKAEDALNWEQLLRPREHCER